MITLPLAQVRRLLARARRTRVVVLGDVMLDQFVWGRVSRISPEAPVPVIEFGHESFMPGGAANVARNLSALGARVELLGLTGRDPAARQLRTLLAADGVHCDGLLASARRTTTCKTRIIAHRQQVARVDRESAGDVEPALASRVLRQFRRRVEGADAVVVGDYGKGMVTQRLLDEVKTVCRARGLWLSLDPKPVHHLRLDGLSLITPNRKEAFELAGCTDPGRPAEPLHDAPLCDAVRRLMAGLQPALLLVTLGDQGMLLCGRDRPPHHIPTAAREVFDVSGAGDTVIASFTLAIAAGAAPVEAAIFSNHAAGVVVGKVGTATVTPAELEDSFRRRP